MGHDVNGLYRWGFSGGGGTGQWLDPPAVPSCAAPGFAGGLRQLVKDAGLGFLFGGGVM
ncbi:MAG: hypothetical protein ACKO45_13360 [Cyanobium sp.]